MTFSLAMHCRPVDARCRVKGVLETCQWHASALNGRSPGLHCGIGKGCRDRIWKALEAVHCPAGDLLSKSAERERRRSEYLERRGSSALSSARRRQADLQAARSPSAVRPVIPWKSSSSMLLSGSMDQITNTQKIGHSHPVGTDPRIHLDKPLSTDGGAGRIIARAGRCCIDVKTTAQKPQTGSTHRSTNTVRTLITFTLTYLCSTLNT